MGKRGCDHEPDSTADQDSNSLSPRGSPTGEDFLAVTVDREVKRRIGSSRVDTAICYCAVDLTE